MAKAKKARAGLGVLPMTKKTTNPSGNKNQPVQKVPQTGAAPKVADPRDEAIKLVAKKMKQDKKQVPQAAEASVPVPMPTPQNPVPLVPPMQPNPQEDETRPIPVKMKKGGMKDKKGLAVVIGMEPSYEEASKGTPQDPPPGATADEVKDDQHVLLSEGELVVPANVVRYHGLGLYEGLRRDALQGLGEMEKSGQVEYINDEPKKAAAGLALASGPSVATTSGIAQQQQQYNPSLGLYGTATTPQAASAKYMTTNFVDRNKDGISDNLQPSVNKGLVAPANYIAPANLALGPVTNPNMVVGAPNVRSYEANQTQTTDAVSTAAPADTTQRSAPIVQQPRYEQSSDDGQSEEALLGGARTTINGIDYAVQYDFKGNIIGLANVAESMNTGRANFFEPSNELKGLIAAQTAGQNAQLRAMASPAVPVGTELLSRIDEKYVPDFLSNENKKIEAARAATDKLNRYTGTMSRQEEMAKPDIIYGDAAIDDLEMGFTTPKVDAPKVETSDVKIEKLAPLGDEKRTAVGSASELRTANIGTPPGSKERIYEDRMFQSGINRQSPSPYSLDVPMPSELGFSEDRVSDAYSDGYEGAPTYRGPGKQLGEETGTSEFQARKEQREQQEEREALLNQPNRQTPSSFVAQNFSEAGKQDVSVHNRGEDGEDKGPLGIGVNNNGTLYSRNRDGTFTHEDGTTVNFTGTDGKPGNAPTKGEVEASKFRDREKRDREFGEAYGTSPGKDDCVIATHGLSTGGFTIMEKAKAELWCLKTYHGKWYGEAFRRGYRAAGMKHINAGTAPDVYQEFKDFVAYGRGIKKGWKVGLNYYLRTLQFFLTGLFLK